MTRKLLAATVSAALCIMSVTPAMAQDYRFSGYNAPQGATATVNLRVPLTSERRHRPTFGITAGFGRSTGSPDLDGRLVTRSTNIADIRFSTDGELRQARVASFDLANLDRDRRLNMTGGTSTFTLIGIVATAAAICFVITDCFGDDDEDDDDNN